jgi:hypothetical protein
MGSLSGRLYSNVANWSPAEVANNSAAKVYDVTVPEQILSSDVVLDIDATVRNFTLSGRTFEAGGHSYTVNGTATLVGAGLLEIISGSFLIKGALSNFDGLSNTLSGGRYSVLPGGTLRFPGADIVNNGASISLEGETAAITDTLGRDALRNFAGNLPGASFTVVARDYAIDNLFTNDGLITLGIRAESETPPRGALLTIGNLTNYDAQSHRLSGGSYDIIASAGSSNGIPPQPAQLIVGGADIVRNATSIILEVSGAGNLVLNPAFTDENGNNALRNFAENEATGVFQLKYLAQPLQTNSDFTNEGVVLLQMSSLSLPPSHVYRQVRGRTTLNGGSITGNVEISGGELVASDALNQANSGSRAPAISGNLTVGDGMIDPIDLKVDGSVLFLDTSRFLLGATPGQIGLTAQSTVSLAGTLEVYHFPSTVVHAAAISGAFKNAPNGSRIFTMDGQGSLLVTYTSTDVTLSDFQPIAASPRLLNISARAQVLIGDQVAIGGFILTGSDWKNVVIRATGPSLASAAVAAPLQDPVIELHDSKGALIATNDNWEDRTRSELFATNLAPKDARESGIFVALAPGAYTAIVRGANETSGTAVVEVYDVSSGSPTKLANISTRAFVDANNVLIGGLIAGGGAQDKVKVVVRAIGAGLQASGVQNFLPDAALEVRDKNGALIVANDDFGTPSSNPATVPPALQPKDPTDAATGLSLAPGNYTVIVHGKDGASGIALVEIYDVTG